MAEGFIEEPDKRYLDRLLLKARSFVNGDNENVIHLYRNQSKKYFDEVEKNGKIMKPRQKDFVGDPRSPINGNLSGVFFGVTLFNGILPTISPYGKWRICIPLQALFDETSNLYFADFYCIGKNDHYVILVLTKAGSRSDTFCKKHLPQLDPNINDFLWKYEEDFCTVKQDHLWVEVFYTENVSTDIPGALFENGFERRRVHGKLTKNRSCEICNVPEKKNYAEQNY